MIGTLMFMAMELCWFAGLLVVVDTAFPGPQSAAMVATCLLYPAATLARRIVRRLPLTIQEELYASVGLFALGIGALSAVLIFGSSEEASHSPRISVMVALGALAWTRGWLLGGRGAELERFIPAFQFGIFAVLAALAGAQAIPMEGALPYALTGTFMAVGLVGLWQARSEATTRAAEGVRRGAGAALLGLVLVLIAGALLWLAVDHGAMAALLDVINRVWERFTDFLASLKNLLPGTDDLPDEPELIQLQEQKQHKDPIDHPALGLSQFGFETLIAFAAAVGIAVWAYLLYRLYLFFSSRRHQVRRTPGVVYRRSGSWKEFIDGLRQWFLSLGRGLADVAKRLRRTLSWRRLDDSSVRDIYRRLLIRLAVGGWRRARHETPNEYLVRVKLTWKGEAAELETLTAAFVADRYGGITGDAATARLTWRQLLRTMRKARMRNG
jgi:hypothetical protein